MKIKNMIKRCLSGFLTLIVLIQAVPLTVSADTNAKSFIDFYANGDGSVLEAKNLTTQDYYVLNVFLSNWFQPGVTRLSDLKDGNDDLINKFATAFGLNKDQVKKIVQAFGKDVYKGIDSGVCTLYGRGGGILTGPGFLEAIRASVADNGTQNFKTGHDIYNNYHGLKKSEIHFFDGKKKVAIDFSAPAMKAAMQTVFGYSPDLFLHNSGIHKFKMMYIDAVGNIWGATHDAVGDYAGNPQDKGKESLPEDKCQHVYLVLPACLNPSTFSPNITEQSKLRMPLMNRFVLSSIMRKDDMNDSSGAFKFSDEYIPIYNLLTYSASSERKNALNVFGLHALSPYSMNTKNIRNKTWKTEARRRSMGNFIYNYEAFNVKGSESTGGKSKYETNSYIVFSTSMEPVRTQDGKSAMSLDMNEEFLFISDSYAFNVYTGLDGWGEEAILKCQKHLLMYFLNPTVLSLNQVSMNCYNLNLSINQGDGAETAKEAVIQKLAGAKEETTDEAIVQGTALASAEATKMGFSGMSLFLNDVQISFEPDEIKEKFFSVAPDNIVHSKLVQQLKSNISGERSLDTFNKAIKGETEYAPLKYLFLSESQKIKSAQTAEDILSPFGINVVNFGNDFKKDSEGEATISPGAPGDFKNGMNFGVINDSYYEDSYRNETGDSDSDGKTIFHIFPRSGGIMNIGNDSDDIAFGRTLSLDDNRLVWIISTWTNRAEGEGGDNIFDGPYMRVSVDEIDEYIMAFYGYSIFYPSDGFDAVSGGGYDNIMVVGNDSVPNSDSRIKMQNFSQTYMMGVYLGYLVDMMGLGTCVAGETVGFGMFHSPFLPTYDISSSGANLSIENMLGNSGLNKSEDLSFEEMQKDLIRRIYGITNDTEDSYRNSLIKSIIEGFILTVHRTITGTWGSNISSISTGDTSTYQSVTGYIYTPTLEELSFTSDMMNNYIKIYTFLLIFVLFMMIIMVLLHMRTWQQGVLSFLVMCLALLFPYILISNTINISNTISNNIYSDRFDFWAMSEHYQSLVSLRGSEFMDEKDKWLAEGNATADVTAYGGSGVKVKWMAPKKVDMFQNLYSDASLSQSFVTNIEIFKWLFASTIYDSEFVDTDVYGSYVYRTYNNIALDAEAYYKWGSFLESTTTNPKLTNQMITYKGNTYNSITGLSYLFNDGTGILSEHADDFSAGFGYLADEFYTSSPATKVKYSDDRWKDIKEVGPYIALGREPQANQAKLIGTWGMFNEQLATIISDETHSSSGISSNLPLNSYTSTTFDGSSDATNISKALFLKNTESPYYYFYSVLKKRYSETSGSDTTFKRALLEEDIYKVSSTTPLSATNRKVSGSYRDFLDMQGLFTYVIPYLNLTNEYVAGWQKINGSEIEEYNFDYEVDDDGNVIRDTLGGAEKDESGTYVNNTGVDVTPEYEQAVNKKNEMNKIWNMYSPWVDTLYELDIYNKKAKVAGKKIYIDNTLNPSSYINSGRPMIFSEADMIVKGYNYADLTDIERRIQAVTEKTYKDLRYLLNYYDMDDEVLLCAAAMYATFNFNTEFSQTNFLKESSVMYPQGFELKNFNYDAFMRLALLNSTGETVFATEDLYARVLSKTSLLAGLFLLICDLIACVAIPFVKFAILLALLVLGILMCLTCVINPPEKIMGSINKSVLLPTVLFMGLNIVFAWGMSLVVGEGLTSYVGSKSAVISTNDPSITMIIMAAMGIAYLFFCWKIIKLIVQAYKKFGMSTVLATVGIIGSAGALVAKKAKNLTGKVMGTSAGAVVGAATAGKGNRLSGALEGGSHGAKGVINQRIRENRHRKMTEETNNAANADLAKRLDKLSKNTGDGSGQGSGGNSDNNGHSSGETPMNAAPMTKEQEAEAKRKNEELQAKLKRRQELRKAEEDAYYDKLEKKYGKKIDAAKGNNEQVNTSLNQKRQQDAASKHNKRQQQAKAHNDQKARQGNRKKKSGQKKRRK